MSIIKIDNKEYNFECKAQLASMQFVEQELAYPQAKAAALQTAGSERSNTIKLPRSSNSYSSFKIASIRYVSSYKPGIPPIL
jgi:hypothetical protein